MNHLPLVSCFVFLILSIVSVESKMEEKMSLCPFPIRMEEENRLILTKEFRYSNSSFCLICLSEEFLLIFEENSSLLILFDHQFNDLWIKRFSINIVDLCYSSSSKCFFILNEKEIFRFDPNEKSFSSISTYQLIKSNRLMSSICSTNDSKLFILYRFGEYLDVYPRDSTTKIKIWKRKHFCQTFEEEVFLIRSSNHENPQENRFALLIVEFNEIWRIDIYSFRFHRLHEGFRFSHWNRQTYLNEHLFDKFIWSVDHQNQLWIDSSGQPSNKSFSIHPNQSIQCRSIRLSNEKHLILFRDQHYFRFYQQISFSSK